MMTTPQSVAQSGGCTPPYHVQGMTTPVGPHYPDGPWTGQSTSPPAGQLPPCPQPACQQPNTIQQPPKIPFIGSMDRGQMADCIPCGTSDTLPTLWVGDHELNSLRPLSPTAVDFEEAAGLRGVSIATAVYRRLMERTPSREATPLAIATGFRFTSNEQPVIPSFGWLVRWHVRSEDSVGPTIRVRTQVSVLIDGGLVDRDFTMPLIGGVDPATPMIVRGSFVVVHGKRYTYGSSVPELHLSMGPTDRALELTKLPAAYEFTAYDLTLVNDDMTRVIGALRAGGYII